MNEVVSKEERLRRAMETLHELGGSSGDDFDIGQFSGESQFSGDPKDIITSLIANPRQLSNSFNLSSKQADNVAAIITGGVAGAGRKYLSRYIGAELAGAVSGFLGAFISKKVVGR